MELIYLLFILSGVFKANFRYLNIDLIPLDFTFFTALLLLLTLFTTKRVRISVNKSQFYLILILGVFYSFMLISLTYSVSRSYSYTKTFYFLTNIIAFCYPFLVKDFDSRKFLRYFMWSTIIFSILLLIAFHFEYRGDSSLQRPAFTDYSGLTLGLAEISGLIFVLLATSSPDTGLFPKKYKLTLALLFFVILVLMGSRGPLLIALFLFLIYKALNLKSRFTVKRQTTNIILISLITLPFLIIAFQPVIERAIFRMSVLLKGFFSNEGFGDSVSVRINLISISLQKITHDLIHFIAGYGIGSFNIVTTGVDARGYPHNIILEIMFELGLVGLLISLLFFIYFFMVRKNKSIVPVYSIIFLILNLLKSGSLVDMRILFSFLAIALLNENFKQKPINEKNLSPDISA